MSISLRSVVKRVVDPVLYRVDPDYAFHRARRDWNLRARTIPKETTATFDAADWDGYWESGRRDLDLLLGVAREAGPLGTELAVEVGCGLGRITRPLAERFQQVVGVDISKEMLRQARAHAGSTGIRYELVGETHRLPVADGTADLVLAWTVFRHTSKSTFSRYLEEARRVLKPRGCLVFEAQIRQTGAPGEPAPYDSLTEREYTRAELQTYCAARGFFWAADRISPSVTPDTFTLTMAWTKASEAPHVLPHAAASGMSPAPVESSRRAVSNTLVQLLPMGMRMVLGLALAAALSRYLGVGGLGSYALIFAYVAMFSGVLNDWGLGTVCLREIAQRPQERARLVASAATLQGLIALASFVLMLASLALLRYPPNVVTGIAVYGLTILLAPLDILALLFQADLRLAKLLAPSLLGVALNFALSLAIILLHGPLLALISAALASLLAQYAWVTFLSLKVLGGSVRPSTLEWPSFAREAWPLGTATVVTTAFQQAPILALSAFSLAGVGLFNAANKIPLQLLLLPLAVRTTVFPLLSATWMTDRPRFRRLLARTIGASLAISIPLTMFGLGLAKPLMVVLFGSGFAGAALPFALLLAVLPLMFPAILLGEALIAASAQRVNLAILGGGLPVLVVLLVAMVPAGGASGAALAVVCSYAVIAAAVFLAAGLRLATWEPLLVASRATPAAGLGVLALALTTSAGPVPSAVIASLVSLAALAALQPAPLHDLLAVTRRAAPRLGIRRRLRALRYRLGLEPIREVSYLGHSFRYPRDSVIGNAIAQGLEWDAVLRPVVATLILNEQPVICEVGSNLGASLLQILAVRPRARVLAYEPSQRFRPLLERNLALAGFSHVEVVPAFLGRSRGQIQLHNNATSASAVRGEYDGHEPRGTQVAAMTTLDEEFLARGQVDFVKVDTDGFDFEVLRGGEKLLTKERPLLFFEFASHLLVNPDAEIRWLQALGYRRLVCFTPTPGSRVLGITDDPSQVVAWAQNNGYCDVLVCPQGSPFEPRLDDLLRSGGLGHG